MGGVTGRMIYCFAQIPAACGWSCKYWYRVLISLLSMVGMLLSSRMGSRCSFDMARACSVLEARRSPGARRFSGLLQKAVACSAAWPVSPQVRSQ